MLCTRCFGGRSPSHSQQALLAFCMPKPSTPNAVKFAKAEIRRAQVSRASCLPGVARPYGQVAPSTSVAPRCHHQEVQACSPLALRASVLRRAVSSSGSAHLRAAVRAGRPVAHLSSSGCWCASVSGLANVANTLCNATTAPLRLHTSMLANPSFNRTCLRQAG